MHRDQRDAQAVRHVPIHDSFDFIVRDELETLEVVRAPVAADSHLHVQSLVLGFDRVVLTRLEAALLSHDPQHLFQGGVVDVAGPPELGIVGVALLLELRREQVQIRVGDGGAVQVQSRRFLAQDLRLLGLDVAQFRVGVRVVDVGRLGDLLLQRVQNRLRITLLRLEPVVAAEQLEGAFRRLRTAPRQQIQRPCQRILRHAADRQVAGRTPGGRRDQQDQQQRCSPSLRAAAPWPGHQTGRLLGCESHRSSPPKAGPLAARSPAAATLDRTTRGGNDTEIVDCWSTAIPGRFLPCPGQTGRKTGPSRNRRPEDFL